MAKKPDRLNIAEEDKRLFDELKEIVFLDLQNKEQFLFAMAYGFKYGARRELGKREGFVRAEYLNGKDKALIYALALIEKKSEIVLTNLEEVFLIAEEYAHGGIRVLFDYINSIQHGSFFKHLESDLVDSINDIVGD